MSMEGGGPKRPLTKDQSNSIQVILNDKNITADQRALMFRNLCVTSMQNANSQVAIVDKAEKKLEEEVKNHQKTKVMKDKLEELCRNLQKQHKMDVQQQETLRKQQEERTMEIQSAVDSIGAQIQQQNEDKNEYLNTIHAMESRNANLIKKLEIMEEHQAKLLQAKDLELQLSEAKSQHEIKYLQAQLGELSVSSELQKKLIAENAALRESLEQYKQQFTKVMETMTKSETMYDTFKKEMKDLSKKRLEVETENHELRDRVKSLVSKVVAKEGEIARLSGEAQKKTQQLEKMTDLCKVLKSQLDTQRASSSLRGEEEETPVMTPAE